MHLSDALISPAVGAACWAAAAAGIAWSARELGRSQDDRRAVLMGVLGAFVFAAQMVNFAIPGTGASGHLSGGLLLAILLGPHAAALTLSSVLFVQAFLFGDGGLLALGANILNVALLPAYVVYPLIYRPLCGAGESGSRRQRLAVLVASVAALQIGAISVAAQTLASGISALPPAHLLAALASIQSAIGLGEGLVTLAVLAFLARAEPGLLASPPSPGARPAALAGVVLAGALAAAVGAQFASPAPDGLVWSIERTQTAPLASRDGPVHRAAADMQARTALMPEYALPSAPEAGPAPAGLLGGVATAVLVLALGGWMRRRQRTPAR